MERMQEMKRQDKEQFKDWHYNDENEIGNKEMGGKFVLGEGNRKKVKSWK